MVDWTVAGSGAGVEGSMGVKKGLRGEEREGEETMRNFGSRGTEGQQCQNPELATSLF